MISTAVQCRLCRYEDFIRVAQKGSTDAPVTSVLYKPEVWAYGVQEFVSSASGVPTVTGRLKYALLRTGPERSITPMPR